MASNGRGAWSYDPDHYRAWRHAKEQDPAYVEARKQQRRDSARRQREALIVDLGGACVCCGESQYEFLQVDHKDGTGAERRREFSRSLAPSDLRRHMDELQVLCGNCHNAKSSFGACPHATLRLEVM